MKIINLDQAVLNALELISKNPPKKINLKSFQFPFVVGSGNAYYTGTILFSQQKAIFANENNFRDKAKTFSDLVKKKIIKEAVIISASGEKDSVWQIELAKKIKLHTTLLTCSANSTASKLADKVQVFSKVDEPYTYNVSTYLSMITGATKESPEEIKSYLKKLKFPKNFSRHQNFSFILPDKFSAIAPMLEIKGRELFGSKLNLKAYGLGEAKHAKYVIPCQKELVISIGEKNKYFGHPSHRWDVDLPKTSNFGLILALSYYIIGKIQEAKPNYFKKNIENYCKNVEPKIFNKQKPTDVIVRGNIK
ncbi:MAG: hypothetical protein K9M44_01405 [Candidatus Pacebacteria bacterium]|nr:hypothetical protein [Candidatus Paceibacterota bacterium]